MAHEVHGHLVPVGGGDNIPLVRDVLTIGRRSSCDICFRFPNVSSKHCELSYRNGYWFIRDLNSTNGIKVNGVRVMEKTLHPSDEISIGRHRFSIEYELPLDRRALEEQAVEEDVMGKSLLEKAGLARRGRGKSIDYAKLEDLGESED